MTLFENKRKEIEEKKKSYISKRINKKKKFAYQISKKKPKYILKSTNDLKYIKELVTELENGEQIHLMSSAFDSPSIIYALDKLKGIKELIASTWAVTDRGLQVVGDLSKKTKIFLLLDKTYSYKWVFASGAIDYLGNINLKFTGNHSKIILIKTNNAECYTFAGSMNLSNNPRIENITITKDKEIFDFYEGEIKREFD